MQIDDEAIGGKEDIPNTLKSWEQGLNVILRDRWL